MVPDQTATNRIGLCSTKYWTSLWHFSLLGHHQLCYETSHFVTFGLWTSITRVSCLLFLIYMHVSVSVSSRDAETKTGILHNLLISGSTQVTEQQDWHKVAPWCLRLNCNWIKQLVSITACQAPVRTARQGNCEIKSLVMWAAVQRPAPHSGLTIQNISPGINHDQYGICYYRH